MKIKKTAIRSQSQKAPRIYTWQKHSASSK